MALYIRPTPSRVQHQGENSVGFSSPLRHFAVRERQAGPRTPRASLPLLYTLDWGKAMHGAMHKIYKRKEGQTEYALSWQVMMMILLCSVVGTSFQKNSYLAFSEFLNF